MISRQEALERGLRHYETGEPCKHGHIARRYTESGACYACIKANVDAARAEYVALRDADTLRKPVIRFVRETVVTRERVPAEQAPSIAALVAGMLAARFPELVGSDRVEMEPAPRLSAQAGGTALATFLCHRDDVDAVKALAQRAIALFGLAAAAADS